MDFLGVLCWWSVGTPELDGRALHSLLARLDITGVSPPKPIVPADAFRRLTGDSKRSYLLPQGQRVTLDLHPAKSQPTMLVRHIVRTVKAGNVQIAADRVGDCAFYKPPKGQPHRARMRVTPHPNDLPDREQIEAFCVELRAEYDRALRYLDPQAIRRLVRQYLASVDAIYLDGPYFLPDPADADKLSELIGTIGDGSRCYTVPVVDDPPRRAMVAAGVEAAAASGDAPTGLIETYVRLGIVPDSLLP